MRSYTGRHCFTSCATRLSHAPARDGRPLDPDHEVPCSPFAIDLEQPMLNAREVRRLCQKVTDVAFPPLDETSVYRIEGDERYAV